MCPSETGHITLKGIRHVAGPPSEGVPSQTFPEARLSITLGVGAGWRAQQVGVKVPWACADAPPWITLTTQFVVPCWQEALNVVLTPPVAFVVA